METRWPRAPAPQWFAATVAAFVLVFGVAACKPRDAVVHTPEIVGVVRERTLVGTDLRFKLVDGRVFSSPANTDYVGGSSPFVDTLLLAGHSPELWVYRAIQERQAPPNAAICYALLGPTRMSGGAIIKTVRDPRRGEFTLTFPKAPVWTDFGNEGDRLFGLKTCINEAGEAFAQQPATVDGG
jgi:hypothetical protein